ncbi:GntR family transcriptional regulator [Tepidanaerobacter sp. EBM-38]|uniref:GntR family transcriptional regulator n=1 Tax=Tepidanaerobacter sp. EBM-38 TaxID=1918496 RepID=UPI000ABB3FE5|nr:GntR family transcriptional regulator [Tepidanaerobacter sp. EBM-38]
MNYQTAGEQVANILREKILSGEIPDKTKLTQNWISSQLCVSRIPIREALHRLEFECLIERLDNRHTRVLGVSEDMIISRFRFLAALESEAAICISKLKDNSVDISQLRKCASAKASPENELLFHKKLFQLSGDRFLNHVYLLMGEPVLEILLKNWRNSVDSAFSHLAEIVSEIEQRDESKIHLVVKRYYHTLQLEMRFG